jgi:large conductance mechanosensitive channel
MLWMAVGIVIGASFGAIAKSLVDEVIMPPIGLLLGRVDFVNLFLILREGAAAGPYLILAEAREEAPPPPAKKKCPFCRSEIAMKASRCPYCTSELETAV